MSVTERLAGAADRLTEVEVAVPDAGRVLRRSRRRRGSVYGVAVAALVLGGIGVVATSRTDRATVATRITPTAPSSRSSHPRPLLRRFHLVGKPPIGKHPVFCSTSEPGTRSPLPSALVEGFGLPDTFVSDFVPSPDRKHVVAFIGEEGAGPVRGRLADGRRQHRRERRAHDHPSRRQVGEHSELVARRQPGSSTKLKTAPTPQSSRRTRDDR